MRSLDRPKGGVVRVHIAALLTQVTDARFNRASESATLLNSQRTRSEDESGGLPGKRTEGPAGFSAHAMLGDLARFFRLTAMFGELASCSASLEILKGSPAFRIAAVLGGFAAFELRLRLRRLISIRF